MVAKTRKNPVTLKSIAEKANCSVWSVSTVLNSSSGKSSVGKEMREKILKIAGDLGYRRNEIARSIKTGKTRVVGFIGGLGGSFCLEILKGVNDIAASHKYAVKLFSDGGDVGLDTVAEIRDAARQCVEQRLAGVICRSLSEECLDILHEELEKAGIPIVLVDNSFAHKWCPRVVSDDFNGARKAVDYLVELGHTRIAHLNNELSYGFAKVRFDGYAAALKDCKDKVTDCGCCIVDLWDTISDEARESITELLLEKKPTAVFCASDPLAMRLLLVAAELGIKVPEQLSVIGFGGLDYSAFSSPPLTTVRQPFREMGKCAARMLWQDFDGVKHEPQLDLPVELVLRRSTASPNQD